MNWKNILNYRLKTSTLAIQFTGGWADEVNFRTSFSWLVTFYAFLVSCLTTLSCVISEVAVSSLGSAVAIERIFSGGRDTISLRCASLHADSIRILMLCQEAIASRRGFAT
jgi:hypothetical protein